MNMGILVECPECKNRNSLKKQSCKCGKNLRRLSHKCYWIEYYDGGSRRRERTGHSKLGAENRLREVQTAKAEGRYIKKNKNTDINLVALRDWYLDLSEIKQKRSLSDIKKCLNNFIERISKKRHGSNAFFMSGIVNENTGSDTYFNSIILNDNKHRFYNKHHLVPFGEYLPLREILYRPLSLFNIPVSNFASGKDTEKNFETDKGNFGMSICYEDAYGNEIRSSMPAANIFINVSNDAWFGDSIAPHQHLQISRVRAAEVGRFILRSANTGISAIINEKGKIISSSPEFKPYIVKGEFTGFEGSTLFTLLGNKLIVLCSSMILLFFYFATKFNIRPGT